MSAQLNLDALRLELSVKAKNGLDFIVAASLIWSAITLIFWMLPNSPGRSALFTFCMSGVMLPMALLFSKVFRTTWTIKDNPIQPLGLWLNFAQLFYFPILVFMYIKHPQYFIMTYGIITGAHFFPYAWFYNTKSFSVMAGVIALGCLGLGTRLPVEQLYYIPGFIVASLLVLAAWLYLDYQKKRQQAPVLVAMAA
ncbi:DUF7010 family protein [Hymenobacter cellulosivorans]|uniref:Uncharacterized protein n=1 Tax=Hymenobacter cellulosivorans TaxID=2932249 RepID=A0ABY4FHH0_9BACT|nr:hypothetical protein [Hymenobacter cellulosivorans]UOQ55576.1 hypothetical protein MUN80_12635 [Hymenobacter cellulosivorans]